MNRPTTICNHHQVFFYVRNQTEWSWSAQVSDNHHADAVCGLGKEKASPSAQGLIARGVQNGDIKRNAYSITLVPQKLGLPMAKSPLLPGERSPEQLLQTSFLTIGGWENSDYNGDIAWFSTGDGWNQTLTELNYDGMNIVTEYDLTPVMFETGYPFIGMSERFYDRFANTVSRNVPNMDCAKGKHWGLCRVAN